MDGDSIKKTDLPYSEVQNGLWGLTGLSSGLKFKRKNWSSHLYVKGGDLPIINMHSSKIENDGIAIPNWQPKNYERIATDWEIVEEEQ
jgi:hypothetical protein